MSPGELKPQPSMSEQLPILPEELITTEILHRLPAKSIGRFRCVSKEWRSLLSSRQFVKSHLNFNLRRHPQHLIALMSDRSCNVLTLNGSPAYSKVKCPFEKEVRFFQLGGSCHGLVVLSVGDGFIRFLMNPITGEALRVRNWPPGGVRGMIHGLGYDASSDDYKIVNFSWCLGGRSIDVYSVRMKCWRKLPKPRVGFEPHVPNFNAENGSVFVNGCIYWLGTSDDHRNVRGNRIGIFAFNLVKEEFEEIQPPSSVKLTFQNEYEIKDLGGSLALVLAPFSVEYRPSLDVWLMKEHGASDSWTKLTINSPEDGSINVGEYEVISLLNEDEVVLSDRLKFVAYNCRSRIWRDLSNRVADLSVPKAIGVSLVSPNYN